MGWWTFVLSDWPYPGLGWVRAHGTLIHGLVDLIHLANVELPYAELPNTKLLNAELLNADLPKAELLNAESYRTPN